MMKNFRPLTLALATLASASASRLPANLEPFGPEQVCVGRAEVLVRGQPDKKLTQAAQELLNKTATTQKLSTTSYTECPAWLSYRVEVANTGQDKLLVYGATLSLVTPKLETKAVGNLKDETFDYDGGFEYVTLWDAGGQDIAFDTENLAFRLRARLLDLMDTFAADWKKTH
ncbi:hypothetical protein E7T06_17720 [Deinococcus sp. Arct2-2]|uniref:hypothetical protein n=1 Tax=Deinococcus sp. Arct2-2 TaxID=2568653 RepID=UPI0010A31EE8|nr:hypothetical protein [Deinococcus sp. Arct2-2]THF68172.1 hypothetical protein E7T06_17720 [Deinococcus sp. Arct2-2]